jgi:uncharacterized membrane protein
MAGVLDAGWLRVVGYSVVASACAIAGVVELRRPRGSPGRWPTFWLATAVVLVAMGMARAGHAADLVSDVGRRAAERRGWYELRRPVQAVAVAGVAVAWARLVVVAIGRVPERRRRYLPTTVAVITLGCFAIARTISLHHVDTLLYRRDIGGVRVVAVIELLLLAATLITILQSLITSIAAAGDDPVDEQPPVSARR